jgi:outer membrane protein OmpA-like peptidoglycan-associated protein
MRPHSAYPNRSTAPGRLRFFLFFRVILLTVLLNPNALAQELDFRGVFSDAEYYFLYNDFQEALPLYKQLYNFDPNNANVNYRIGLCYLNIPGLKSKSIEFLERAKNNLTESYQEGSFREDKAPLNTFFHLGEAYRVHGNMIQAKEYYTMFKNTLSTRDVFNHDLVTQQIQSCARAIDMMKNPLDIKLEALPMFGENQKYQYNPILSYDGNTMVFTAQEKFYNAIYWVRQFEGQWGVPINITLDLAVEGEVYTTSLNANGTELFLFSNDRGIGNLYHSTFSNGTWGKAKRLGRAINTRGWETHASISPDGRTLFFTSNMRGGVGGIDIYYSQRLESGDWGPAQNIGSTINTPYNEESPFLSADGNTLYFSSQGHNSMGGYDIFYSQRTDDGQWSSPTNMGYPINTPDDDLFYFPIDDNTGLVALIQESNPNVRVIHRLSIQHPHTRVDVAIVGSIILDDGKTITPSELSISLVDSKTGNTVFAEPAIDSLGGFSIPVEPGAYRLVAIGEGYTANSLSLVIPDSYSRGTYPVEVRLTPQQVTEGEFLIIRSIHFDFDSDVLGRDAEFELEKIYLLMEQYSSLVIEVSGHTDNMGSSAYNHKLSLRRAEAVINHLVEKGIAKDRLQARAASTFENIAANVNPDGSDNPEGRHLNRRACVSVISSDKQIVIKEDVNVPEHLKPQEQTFTIIISPVNRLLSDKQAETIKSLTDLQPQRVDGNHGQFAYIIGEFEHKSDAIFLLNHCIANGFEYATLMGIKDLRGIVNRPPAIETAKTTTNENEVYTIQVLAQAARVTDKGRFNGLEVREFKGDDGLFRYVHGEFRGANAAKEEIERVRAMGFPDAFVSSIKRYEQN